MLLAAKPKKGFQEQATSSEKWTICSQSLRARALSQRLAWLSRQWEDSIRKVKTRA